MGVKWEKILEELKQLAGAHGGKLRPEDVVEFARNNPTSSLNEYFEWDDAEAARKWELLEAARKDMQDFLNKYECLEEFTETCYEIRKFLGQDLDD